MSQFNLKNVAKLSKLHFENDELPLLESQVAGILKFVEELNVVDVDGIEPTSHPLAISNVFREDEIKSSLSIEGFLKQAPQSRGNFFEVPKIIENKS